MEDILPRRLPAEQLDPSIVGAVTEPFRSYYGLLWEADQAKCRLHRAQIGEDREAAQKARGEYDQALTSIYDLKHSLASILHLMIRCSGELFPGHLSEMLGVTDLEDVLVKTLQSGRES